MATAFLDEPIHETVETPPTLPSPDAARDPRWLSPLVLVFALGLAAFVFAWFCDHSRQLWWWIGHDRHAHYMNALNLALDVRTGDIGRLWHDFDRLRVWGPFHAVVLAGVQLVAGPDHRLSVLPSLVGWIIAIWFAFLIPRRLLTTGGNAAGLLAAFFVAISPAHRAYATDCMYESLGAGLSLAALYFYLAAVQENARRFGIALGVTLTALFLHKYNYWLLVLFGILAGEFARQPRAWCQYAWSLCARERLPSWLVGELKQPLNWIALALASAAIGVVITGGGVITLAGRSVSFQEPHNLIHAAYIALFIRGWLWWRNDPRAEQVRELNPTLQGVLFWHGGAIALWFLLPKRLSYFFWYLSPANNDQPKDTVPFLHGLPSYVQGLQADYLTLSWGIFLFAGMLALAVLYWRWLKPGSAALFFFFLIAAYLTCQHPMLKNRFLHSWIAAGWVIGAAGLVGAVQVVAGLVSAKLQPWAAGGVCALVVGLHSLALLEPGHAQEGGIRYDYPIPLVIPETYLPHLADAKEPTIFSNISIRFMLSWTFIEHHGHQRFMAEIKNYRDNFENNPTQIERWLASTRSDTLVVIDVHPGTKFDWKTKEYVDLTALNQVLSRQEMFRQTRRWDMPDGVTITLWKKQ